MRLIGGNISDTPVKEIGDGSAFNVGGAAGSPALAVIGSFGTATATSSFVDDPSDFCGQSGVPHCGTRIVKWADNSFGIFSLEKASPYALKYTRLSTNADGTFAAEGTEVDLSGDFTTPNGVYSGFDVKKLSASRVVIGYGIDASAARKLEFGVYDLDGDSLSLVGSVLSRSTATNSAEAFSNFCMAVLGAATACVWMRDGSNSSTLTAISATVVGTQTFDPIVTQASATQVAGPWPQDTYINSSGRVLVKAGGIESRWDLVASPLSVTYVDAPVDDAYGTSDANVMGDMFIHGNDTDEAGRHFWVKMIGSKPTVILRTGDTTNSVVTLPICYPPTLATVYDQPAVVELSLDTETGWGKYILFAPHSTTNTGLHAIPFNLNTKTLEMVHPDPSSDVGYSTNFLTTHRKLFGAMHGNSSATNIVVLGQYSGAERYINVAITL